jgi:hypothetical protein
MWWKLCHPSLGLKAELRMETFAKANFRARFHIIRSPPPPAAGYMFRNPCIVSRKTVPSFRFELFHFPGLIYQIQCSKLVFLVLSR